ncbi:hypothetical protein EDB81DRAFT_693487 [Dactylonectria macrodidyma]|uniref:Uncharacterized protein n=1 Tax=Dactylonectria macrodidyma TaxID=307937 RepID=A0A9P9IWN0_9HYPO|nr:hypothetical protein EDB81DRAFT_693487 [Dactylonectria macrodidyma]
MSSARLDQATPSLSMAHNDRDQAFNRSRNSSIAFINLSHPDDIRRRDIQVGIRRHVMADIGQSRRKRPRHFVVPLEINTLQLNGGQFQPEERSPDGRMVAHELDAACPPQVLPLHQLRLNQLGIFGIDLDHRTLQIVHFMMSQLETRYTPFHGIWARMGFSDSNALYLSMATTLLSQDRRGNIPAHRTTDNSEAVEYYSKALKGLSKRLSDPFDQTSPGVIATIIGCLCHDVQLGEWERWSAHIDGLDQVFKLRGGTDGLENHIPLLAFWLDLVGRSTLDIPPRFPIPKELTAPNMSPEAMPPAMRLLLPRMQLEFPQLSSISEALYMMSSVAQRVNSNSHSLDLWRNEVGAVSLLGPVTHHLLSLPHMSGFRSDAPGAIVVGEMVRLVCLMLLSYLKGLFSLNTLDMVPLCAKFMAAAARPTRDDEVGQLNDLRLWALITSGLLLSNDDTRALLPHIRAAMRFLGITDIHHAFDLAKGLLWLHVVEGQGEAQLTEVIGTAAGVCA